jgi:cell division septum initiation protein DivIVA
MWLLSVVVGALFVAVRRHHGTAKPKENDSSGAAERRPHDGSDQEAWSEYLLPRVDALVGRLPAGVQDRLKRRGERRTMPQRGVHEVRFPVAFGGYAREAVDTVVEQCDLRIRETRAQRERTEEAVAEADGRVQALEARVADLENSGAGGSLGLTDLAEEFLENVQQTGRDLQNKVVSQARAEMERLKERATMEPTEEARARAEEIAATARRNRDQLARMVEESHRQVVELLEEGRTMADERARVTWDKAQDGLREPVLELLHLNERRRTMLQEVVQLQESVETSWGRLLGG